MEQRLRLSAGDYRLVRAIQNVIRGDHKGCLLPGIASWNNVGASERRQHVQVTILE